MFVLIIQVYEKFDLMHDTLIVPVSLIDMFSTRLLVVRKKH